MVIDSRSLRRHLKRGLAGMSGQRPASGMTVLIYHRVGGGTRDERDVDLANFERQLDILTGHHVAALDDALDALEAGDAEHRVVLTFDDGFADVHEHAHRLLAERNLPYTLYVATAYVGSAMHWEGSAAAVAGPALSWSQLTELAGSSLCTIGNHTHSHISPEQLNESELDRCSDELRRRVGVRPRHFAYPWGVRVPAIEPAIRARFRSAVTGELGRNHPGADPLRLRRVPVRGTDPPAFFAAKLCGQLGPERAYAVLVAGAKRLGVPA